MTGIKKRIILSIFTVACVLAVTLIIINKNLDDSFLEMQELEQIPLAYSNETLDQGSLNVINYQVPRLGQHNLSITKQAMVYLPYGYSKGKKYDILYLMHGRGGSYKTWLGVNNHPGTFKNILDNMIENRDIEPLIVVCPNLAYEYGTDNRIMLGTEHEIVNYLMPAVESRYNTYAKEVTPEGFTTSRDHRCFAGFSMGGSLTWHMLRDHVDYFRLYVPMSMATYYDKHGYSESKSLIAADKTKRSLRKSGYGAKDFEVFAATGDEDHKAEATAMQVFDLTDNKEFVFTDTDFRKGNITFKMWPGKWHSYKNSYPYLCNALIHFYQD